MPKNLRFLFALLAILLLSVLLLGCDEGSGGVENASDIQGETVRIIRVNMGTFESASSQLSGIDVNLKKAQKEKALKEIRIQAARLDIKKDIPNDVRVFLKKQRISIGKNR